MKAKKIKHAIDKKLEDFLKKAKAKFQIIEHKVVYTAQDAAQTTKKKLKDISKVVLIKADKDFLLVVVPSGKYVDLKAVKKAVQAKKVKMATEKDITKYLKTKVGLLHPFASLYKTKMETLLDKSLVKAKKMITSAGSYTVSIEINPKDFIKHTNPLKGSFSKSKK